MTVGIILKRLNDLGNAQRQYPGFNFGVSSVAPLNAAVWYRSKSGGGWNLYGQYSDYSTASSVVSGLNRQYSRYYYFGITAR